MICLAVGDRRLNHLNKEKSHRTSPLTAENSMTTGPLEHHIFQVFANQSRKLTNQRPEKQRER